jgi:hypothetical protein
MYRQIIHIEFDELPPVDYQSDWLPWRLEDRPNGIPYLHLEGMRLCAFNPAIPCSRPGGDGHDFCLNSGVAMEGEGILIVLGSPTPLIRFPGGKYAPRGIKLLLPAGSENSWVYDLEEP